MFIGGVAALLSKVQQKSIFAQSFDFCNGVFIFMVRLISSVLFVLTKVCIFTNNAIINNIFISMFTISILINDIFNRMSITSVSRSKVINFERGNISLPNIDFRVC